MEIHFNFMQPSKSPSQEDCTWFALHHIDGYIGIGKKGKRVRSSNGSTINVERSKYFLKKSSKSL